VEGVILTSFMRFAFALHTDDRVKYSVTVPDLPGCFSAGDTLDEAVDMAREAIDAHCEFSWPRKVGTSPRRGPWQNIRATRTWREPSGS
jgi:predicted RNase H-like HicB family nuclease